MKISIVKHTEAETLKHLHEFYKDWLIWVSEGAKAVEPFSRHHGLCMALECWVFHKELSVYLMYDMKTYMKDDFRNEGLDTVYPFGEEDWNEQACTNTMDKCPKRFAFVYNMVNKGKYASQAAAT